MLVRILRLRLLALLLLAGSPGLGGLALAALHPCAASVATAEVAADEHHGGHHGGNHGAPADDICRCIGACQAAFAAPSPTAEVVARAETPPAGASRLAENSPVAAASAPRHLLPPSTAPPQA